MQFLGIGDLHLTTHTGHSYWSRFEELLKENSDEIILTEVRKILKYAVKNGVVHIFFYGDLCHGPRMSYRAHLLLAKLFADYPKLSFHLIKGNHDCDGAVEDGASRAIDASEIGGEHSLQLLELMACPNVSLYTEPKTVLIEGVKVQFLPYPHPLEGESAFDPSALNVFHKETAGAAYDNGNEMKGEHLVKVSKKVLGASGHLHTNQRVRNLHYVGSPIQHTFGERQEKFFHHGQITIRDKARRKEGTIDTEADDWEIVDVPINPKYRLLNVHIETLKDFKKLREVPKNTLVKIHMDSKVVFSPEQYEKYAKDVLIVGFNPYAHKALEDEVAKMDEASVMEGDEVIINKDDFLRAWFSTQNMDEGEVDEMMKLRRKMRKKLGGV